MKNFKKLLAMLIAVMTIFMMSGVSVFAAPVDVSDYYKVGSVEVTGIKEGNTLKLYKIVQFNLDRDTNEFTYTLATGLPADYDTIEEIGALQGTGYTFNNDAATKQCADVLANGIAAGTITPIGSAVTATASGDSGTATIENLPAGWYVAVVSGTKDDSIIYQNMIINAMPVVDTENNTYKKADDVSFEVKHTEETITKTVGADNAESTDKYSVGDTVPFVINTTIPNYPNPSKVATFEISDTPNDLTDDASSVAVKVNGTTVAAGADTFEVTAVGDGFKIVFAKAFILTHPAQPVVVTYNATIKSTAAIADDGLTADNTAKIKFNPNPNEDGTVEPEDKTKLYTYGLTVLKHEEGDESKTLKGAKFILYASDGTTIVRPETQVDDNGKLTWDGLEAGSYKLVETVAPTGYKLDSTPRDITLSSASATGDDPLKDGTQTYVLEAKVPNTPGSTLPSTGGIGTTIFYALGAILVIGCGILLIARKRAANK